MAGILDLMGHIQQQGEMGRARGQQNKLAGLYSQAFSAPREQRQGLLSQIAAVSPDSAQAASGMFDKMDDNSRAELGQYAAAFSALPDDQKAAAYPQLAQQAAQMGLPVPQGGYRPEYAQGIRQLAQAFGGVSSANNVQSRFVNERGEVMALLRDGTVINTGERSDPQRWFRDLPGMAPQVVDEFGRVNGVGRPGPAASGEVPFSIDPRLPQEVQDAIRNDPNAGSAQGITSLNMGGSALARPSEAQVAADVEAAKVRAKAQAEAAAAPMAASTAGTVAAGEQFGKDAAGRFEQIVQRGSIARSENASLEAMRSLLANTYTGTGAEAVLGAKRLAAAVGIETDGLGEAEAARAISNQLALKLRNPAGGEGMPGQMSNRDLTFLKESIPSLRNSPNGWRKMIQMKMALNNAAIQQAEYAEQLRQDGVPVAEIPGRLRQFAEENPIFITGQESAPANSGFRVLD